MNCEELNQDIKNLKDSAERISTILSSATQSSEKGRKIRREIREKTVNANSILEKYQKQFLEKFPDTFEWSADRIEIDSPQYRKNSIDRIVPLPDNNGILINGGRTLHHYQQQGDKWVLKKEYPCNFEEVNAPPTLLPIIDVYALTPVPGANELLVGGHSGLLRSFHKEGDEWVLGELIDNDLETITTIVPLPDQSGMLIGGTDGGLRVFKKEGDNWIQGDEILDEDGFPISFDISCLVPMPNNNDIIVGAENELYSYSYSKSEDSWTLKKLLTSNIRNNVVIPLPNNNGMLVGDNNGNIKHYQKENNAWEFKSFTSLPKNRAIHSMTLLPNDNELLVGGSGGMLCSYRLEDGVWKAKEEMTINNHRQKPTSIITFITPTPNDGGVLVGGWTGALYHLRKENGEWQTGERIDIRNTKNEITNSYVALPFPNSPEVLIGGDCGAFYQLRPNKIPSIDQIISKYDN